MQIVRRIRSEVAFVAFRLASSLTAPLNLSTKCLQSFQPGHVLYEHTAVVQWGSSVLTVPIYEFKTRIPFNSHFQTKGISELRTYYTRSCLDSIFTRSVIIIGTWSCVCRGRWTTEGHILCDFWIRWSTQLLSSVITPAPQPLSTTIGDKRPFNILQVFVDTSSLLRCWGWGQHTSNLIEKQLFDPFQASLLHYPCYSSRFVLEVHQGIC